MPIKPHKFTIIIIVALILPTVAVFTYSLYIDPFQIVHKDFSKPYIIFGGRGTDRYQHAGVINHYPVHSIVLGNSYSANYLPSKIRQALKTENVYSLTMDGAPIAEQVFPGRYALGKRHVDHVIWGISYGNLMQPANARNPKMKLPEYLYDANRFNDLKFFLTLDLLKYQKEKKQRKKHMLAQQNVSELQQQEFDRSTAWHWLIKDQYNRPAYVADMIINGYRLVYSQSQVDKLKPLAKEIFDAESFKNNLKIQKWLKNADDNIETNLLPLIRANPKTTFNFVIVPFPTLLSQITKLNYQERYIASLLIIKRFTTTMSPYPNVRIFAFWNEKFCNNLKLFKDKGHSHIEINNYIIEAIGQNQNIVNSVNIGAHLLAFDKRVSRYRLPRKWNPAFINRIDRKGKPLSNEEARKLM